MRFFNTAGPCVAGQHYMIDPLSRLDLPNVEAMIDQQRYFMLHAPRQTGKTSCLLALMHRLNAQGRYHALYANIEAAQAVRGDVGEGVATILDFIEMSAQVYLDDTRFTGWKNAALAGGSSFGALAALLKQWAQASDKPTVLMLDEVDALVGDTLISLLRQLRAGYTQRPAAFPQSVILCGMRDVRDYRIHSKDQEIITAGPAYPGTKKSGSAHNRTATALSPCGGHRLDYGTRERPELHAIRNGGNEPVDAENYAA